MEYTVFNDVVMESTEYAMEGFSIKDGWKKFIEFCKKIIAKCKEALRKIVEKVQSLKRTSLIRSAPDNTFAVNGVTIKPVEGIMRSDYESIINSLHSNLVNIKEICLHIENLVDSGFFDEKIINLIVSYSHYDDNKIGDIEKGVFDKFCFDAEVSEKRIKTYKTNLDAEYAKLAKKGIYDQIESKKKTIPVGTKLKEFGFNGDVIKKIEAESADSFKVVLRLAIEMVNKGEKILNKLSSNTVGRGSASFTQEISYIRQGYIIMNQQVSFIKKLLDADFVHGF